jgi:hypothetical protein
MFRCGTSHCLWDCTTPLLAKLSDHRQELPRHHHTVGRCTVESCWVRCWQLARKLIALLSADDFSALADSLEGLQLLVDATCMWCCKWRMKANVGPTKSAVMLFAPECAERPLLSGDVHWHGEPLPVVDKYKYLGVMLAADCSWRAHIEYVVAKATKASHAMGSVLHNPRLPTEIRRIVLLAKLRPIVEYNSTVWHAADDKRRRQIEAVMVRVLKRFLAVFDNVHHDVLRMELGCRSFCSWMTQRVLEYGFKLQRMQANRLPAAVQVQPFGGACHPNSGPECMLRSLPGRCSAQGCRSLSMLGI